MEERRRVRKMRKTRIPESENSNEGEEFGGRLEI